METEDHEMSSRDSMEGKETRDTESVISDASDEEKKKEEERLEALRLAGKITWEVLEDTLKMIKPGVKVIEICEHAEGLMLEKGAQITFPVNVSINNVAAHYSSPIDDETVIPEKAIVKLDLGARIDGHVADAARTVTFDPELSKLVKAAEEAFKAGMEIVKPGVKPSEVGAIVEEVIKDHGFLPIIQLSGHKMDEYVLHGEQALPNVATTPRKDEEPFTVGQIWAFETFASTGSGSVHHSEQHTYIYQLPERRMKIRQETMRKIVRHVYNIQKTLPFSPRWLTKSFRKGEINYTLRQLTRYGAIIPHPTLIEDDAEARVAQYEDSFIVTEDGYEIYTRAPSNNNRETSTSSSSE